LARGGTIMKNNSTFLQFHKFWLALGWGWMAYVLYLSLIPEPPGPDGPWWDKIGHTVSFTFLMLWFAQLFRSRRTKLWIALGLVAFGVAIEFAQEQTGYRHFEAADMGADAIGVAIGLLLAETPLALVLRQVERLLKFHS
jgi:VanZ family protein